MKLIIEGPDGSGKSTLAKCLAKEFDALLIQNFNRPKHPYDLPQWALDIRYLNRTHPVIVMDRHMAFSELVYGSVLRNKPIFQLKDTLEFMSDYLKSEDYLVIYCRPYTERIVANSMVEKQMDGVDENLKSIIDFYDTLMETASHKVSILWYNYQETQITTLIQNIRERNLKCKDAV